MMVLLATGQNTYKQFCHFCLLSFLDPPGTGFSPGIKNNSNDFGDRALSAFGR